MWTTSTPFFVIVNHYDADVSWTKRFKFPYVIYEKEQPDKEPFNASNKAKSETNLLKFIYEFYDQLPRNVITIHQYEYKWSHEGNIVNILNDHSFEEKYNASLTPGFWNFNTYSLGDIESQIDAMTKSGWWETTMEPYFGSLLSYGNFTRDKKGCAQFVVSRQRIHSLPREFYKNMYDWLITHTLDEPPVGIDQSNSRMPRPTDKLPHSNWYMARYMEWSWELIFTSYKISFDETLTLNGHRI